MTTGVAWLMEEDPSWRPVDLKPHLADDNHEASEPTLLLRQDGEALLYPGRVSWLSGEPEAGKSWLALLATAGVLDGGGQVTYIDYEDGPGPTVRRLRALGVSQPAVTSRFHYVNPVTRLRVTAREALRPQIVRSSLVVIDACTEALALQGLSSKDDVDIAAWLSLLPRWAANLGACVLVLDHVNKDRTSRGRWPTGSQHKMAGVDGAAFTVDCVSAGGVGVPLHSRVFLTKDRHGELRRLAVSNSKERRWIADLLIGETNGELQAKLLPPAGHPHTGGQPAAASEGERALRILAVLDASEAPLSARQVRTGVRGKGTVIDASLNALVAAGRVRVEVGPGGAKLHSLARSD